MSLSNTGCVDHETTVRKSQIRDELVEMRSQPGRQAATDELQLIGVNKMLNECSETIRSP